jgi:hypothetical protein
MPGMSSVLGTEAGFENKELSQEEFDEKIKSTKGIVFTDNYDHKTGLQPARVVDGVFHPAQAIVPWRFTTWDGKKISIKKYIDKNGKLDLTKIDPEILKILSMRIPNQGLNSTSMVEIVGFTTQMSGDLFIATQDFVIQMGSDFDIDKIYSYILPMVVNKETERIEKFANTVSLEDTRKEIKELSNQIFDLHDLIDATIADLNNIDTKEEKLTSLKNDLNNLIEKKQKSQHKLVKILQSDIIDIQTNIHSHPSDEVQSQIKLPLDTWVLADKAKELAELKSQNADKISIAYDEISLYSDDYQRRKFVNATAGKSGVANFSLDVTFNTLCQYAGNLTLHQAVTEKTITPLLIQFGGNISHGDLSRAKTLSGKYYKSTVMQGYQSAAVDNEKLQILGSLNINSYTFNAIRLLIS